MLLDHNALSAPPKTSRATRLIRLSSGRCHSLWLRGPSHNRPKSIYHRSSSALFDQLHAQSSS